MSRATINATMWWLAGAYAAHLTQAANNSTDDSEFVSDASPGRIAGIVLGSLGAVIVVLAITAGCLSCCTTKKTKTTKTSADGSNETIETEERGSQEVAGKIANVAGTVAGEIGEVLAVVTHTTAITTPNTHQSSGLSPNSAQVPINHGSTSVTTAIETNTVLLAIKKDINDGSSDGNKVAAEGLKLLEAQGALAQAEFLMAESAKLQQADSHDHSIDIHPADMPTTGVAPSLPADHQ